jgi:membrane-bound lytic murein transglycosylase D
MLYRFNPLKTKAIMPFFVFILLTGKIWAQLPGEMAVTAPVVELKETILEKPANVVYPNILQCWQTQSIDYVEKYAAKKSARINDIAKKSKKFFPAIVKTFKKYQLPEELKMLIVLESDFNANVISWAGAVGYWQFMDETAREYGLNIITQEEREAEKKKLDEAKKDKIKPREIPAVPKTKEIKKKDDRKNLAKSTKAAARYLSNSFKMFNNDILLAVASYNCGPGNVRKARTRSGVADGNFWDIKDCLPTETRNYVLNFIALNVLFKNYDAYQAKTLKFKPETIKISELLMPEQPVEVTPAAVTMKKPELQK